MRACIVSHLVCCIGYFSSPPGAGDGYNCAPVCTGGCAPLATCILPETCRCPSGHVGDPRFLCWPALMVGLSSAPSFAAGPAPGAGDTWVAAPARVAMPGWELELGVRLRFYSSLCRIMRADVHS